MKWMAASNSFSVSTFGGSLNSLDIFYFGGEILILFQLSGEILILTSFFLSFSMKSWLVRLFFKIAQGDFLVVPPHFLYQNPKTCSAKEEIFHIEYFLVTLASCNSFFILVLKWKYVIFGLTQCYCYTGDLPPSPWIIQTLLVANLRDPPFYGTAIKLRLTCVETRTSFFFSPTTSKP